MFWSMYIICSVLVRRIELDNLERTPPTSATLGFWTRKKVFVRGRSLKCLWLGISFSFYSIFPVMSTLRTNNLSHLQHYISLLMPGYSDHMKSQIKTPWIHTVLNRGHIVDFGLLMKLCEVQKRLRHLFLAYVYPVRSEVSAFFCFRKSDWESLKIPILKSDCYHLAHCAFPWWGVRTLYILGGWNTSFTDFCLM